MCPKHITFQGHDCTFGGLRGWRAYWDTFKIVSNNRRWPSQVKEQHMQSFLYIKRPRFGPSCANAIDMIREKEKGALETPKGKCENTHSRYMRDKAVLSRSLSAIII